MKWQEVRRQLAPHITPGQYVREARAAGATWREILNMLLADTGLDYGCETGTLQYWANVDNTEAFA